jgi:hypothetical protein
VQSPVPVASARSRLPARELVLWRYKRPATHDADPLRGAVERFSGSGWFHGVMAGVQGILWLIFVPNAQLKPWIWYLTSSLTN